MMFDHMPFYFIKDGETNMLLCTAEKTHIFHWQGIPVKRMPWRMHWKNSQGVLARIETGSHENAIECSPTLFYDGSKWVINFICLFYDGVTPSGLLYRMTTIDWSSFTAPELVIYDPCVYGYENNNYLASMYPDPHKNKILLMKTDGSSKILEVEGMNILTVRYRSDDEDKILITGNTAPRIDYSIVYSIQDKTVLKILNDADEPVYKCSILGNKLAYAMKTTGYEERNIAECDVKYGTSTVVVRELQ